MKLQRIGKYYYLRFMRLKGDPQALAWGTAIGVIIGISPTLPFHTIALLIVTFLTRTSTVAALISSFAVCNPLTFAPIYYFSMVIGNKVTPYELTWEKVKYALDILLSNQGFAESLKVVGGLGYEAMIVMVVGGFVLALPFTIVSYYASLHFFIRLRRKRREKHILH